MNVFKTVATMIADHTGSDVASISEGTSFEELGIDSLDIVEMVMKVEEELGVELELQEKYETIGALVEFIESKLNA